MKAAHRTAHNERYFVEAVMVRATEPTASLVEPPHGPQLPALVLVAYDGDKPHVPRWLRNMADELD